MGCPAQNQSARGRVDQRFEDFDEGNRLDGQASGELKLFKTSKEAKAAQREDAADFKGKKNSAGKTLLGELCMTSDVCPWKNHEQCNHGRTGLSAAP